jgi:hypothetical protein
MYSVMVLGGLSLAAIAFIFVSTWIVDQSEDTEAH